MLRRCIGVLLALSALSAAAGTIADDRGVAVRIDPPARRIVTLAPNLAEIAFAAGAGASVVGVSMASDHPEAATRLPVVAASGKVDLEAVLALQPDLVLAWRSGNHARDLAQLEARGIRVFVTEPSQLADIARLVRAVGTLAGTGAAAEREAARIDAALAALQAQQATRRPVKVFYQVWHQPLMTVNGSHFVSALIALCGGRNVLAAAPTLTPTVSAEQLHATDPDAILVSAGPGNEAREIAAWQRYGTLRAVREHRVYAVDGALVNRMGPRVAEAAAAVCEPLDRARR